MQVDKKRLVMVVRSDNVLYMCAWPLFPFCGRLLLGTNIVMNDLCVVMFSLELNSLTLLSSLLFS